MKKTNLYVLTGFLGAGKTTILMKLLEKLEGKKVGVIQNEFGKLGIDGEILKRDGMEMVEINKGSIFCSCLKLSFVSALTEMAKKEFDYLFVESSGLGDPSNVEEILNVVQETSGGSFDFKGVLCLVDSVNFFDQLGDLETVYRQLKHCNMAVLTKVDLVDADQVEKLERKIEEINPVCRIEHSSNGDLDLSFLEEDLMKYQWAESEETTNSEETKPKTLFMKYDKSIDKKDFELFINEIKKDAYRIKGFFNFEKEGWQQVDVVGAKIDYKPCEEKEESHLVIISKIGTAIIKPIFNAWQDKIGTRMELKN